MTLDQMIRGLTIAPDNATYSYDTHGAIITLLVDLRLILIRPDRQIMA